MPGASDDPPPGWVARNNTLEPAFTVPGYRARGEELKGGCRAYGCRRSAWLDPHARLEALLEPAGIPALEKSYRCNRLDGCGFEFVRPQPGQSVRLDQLVGRINVRIRVRCDACRWFRLRAPRDLIASLTRGRVTGARLRITEIGAAIPGTCPACKATAWSAHVIWLRTDTAIWKAKGERMFDEIPAD